MRTDDFWGLVDRARAAAGVDTPADHAPDPLVVAARLTDLLVERGVDDIVGYDRHQRRVMGASYRVDLWGAAYLINGGASDDGFEYFRGWLIAQGRAVFARAVAEPDSLAELPAVRRAAVTGEEFECEEMLGVAWTAHQRLTGSDLPAGPDAPGYPEIGAFWDFEDDEEVRRRLPRLAALFAEPPQE